MGIDLLLLLLIGLNAWTGAKRGLWGGVVDVVSLPLALGLAAWLYPLGERIARWLLGLGEPWAGMLGFLTIAVGLVLALGQLVRLVPKRAHPSPPWDRFWGVLWGTAMGGILVVVLLAAIASTPAGRTLEGSWLGRHLAEGLPRFYTWSERRGFALPKMTLMPRDYREEMGSSAPTQLRFRRLNFARLDGSTCIKCRGEMRFLGYLRREKWGPISPKFQCSRCGRTTDGCQSFEGFHRMYGRCPVEVADEGYLLDCGVWTNGEGVTPRGACPVCGRRAKEEAYADPGF